MIARQAEFLAINKQFAQYLYQWYLANPSGDPALANAYYDGEAAAYKLEHLGLAQKSFDAYVTQYVIPNNGNVQGFRNFTEGQLLDVQKNSTRKTKALQSIQLQLLNGAFVATGNVAHPDLSRECAYAINTHLNAQKAGIVLNATQLTRLNVLTGNAKGHVTAWVNNTAPYYRPFMGALTLMALEAKGIESTFVSAIVALAEKTWTLWKEEAGPWGRGQSFLYTDRNVGDPDDMKTTPDLNNLISPIFALCFKLTKQVVWAERATKAFHGGIPVYSGNVNTGGADLGTQANPRGKILNQSMFWIDKLFLWLDTPAVIQSEAEFLKGLQATIAARQALIS